MPCAAPAVPVVKQIAQWRAGSCPDRRYPENNVSGTLRALVEKIMKLVQTFNFTKCKVFIVLVKKQFIVGAQFTSGCLNQKVNTYVLQIGIIGTGNCPCHYNG